MNLEVFEGATSAKEAVDAGKRARQQRFNLYTDLHSPKGMRALLSHMSPEECHGFANQITQAQSAKGGFPEFLSRKIEEETNLPFGFLDQPYPSEELRASMARAKRLKRMADARGDAVVEIVGKRNYDQMVQACEGLRGVSPTFYEKVWAKLDRMPRLDGLSGVDDDVFEKALGDN